MYDHEYTNPMCECGCGLPLDGWMSLKNMTMRPGHSAHGCKRGGESCFLCHLPDCGISETKCLTSQIGRGVKIS